MEHNYKKMQLLRSGDYYIPVDPGYGILIEGEEHFVAIVLTQENLKLLRKALYTSPTAIAESIELVANAYMADRGLEPLNIGCSATRHISDSGDKLAYQQHPKE